VTVEANAAVPDPADIFALLVIVRALLTLMLLFVVTRSPAIVVVPAPSPEPGKAAAAAPPATGGLVVERRFVRIGPARGERIAVVDGLKAGERVVSAGQIKLQANSPVTVDDRPALPPPAETSRP
jgi:multidrug efflux pump subunit AcrA (membrane-fusion protein)